MKRLLIPVAMLIFLTGCYDAREVEQRGYVVAIGVDADAEGKHTITYAFSNPNPENGDKGSGDHTGATVNVTVETEDLLSGLDIASAHLGKEGTFSHAVLAIFSTQVAYDGIGDYLDALMRDLRTRPKLYLAVCENAGNYLKEAQPMLEANPERYLKQLFSGRTDAPVSGINLNTFYADCVLGNQASLLPMAAITENPGMPERTEIAGVAYFQGDRMVGEGSSEDAEYYQILCGNLKRMHYTIKDAERRMVFDLMQPRHPQISVTLSNGKPHISITVDISCAVVSDTDGFRVSGDYHRILEEHLARTLTEYLKTTASRGADVCGFSGAAKRLFFTQQDFEAYDWNTQYKNADFYVRVRLIVKRNGLITE